MLKGIDQRLSAEIVHVLMLMGHGDDLVICDVNHPAATIAAETTYGKLIDMAGCDIPTAAAAILSLMPLDTFETLTESCRFSRVCRLWWTVPKVARSRLRLWSGLPSTSPLRSPLPSSAQRIQGLMAASSSRKVWWSCQSFDWGLGLSLTPAADGQVQVAPRPRRALRTLRRHLRYTNARRH